MKRKEKSSKVYNDGMKFTQSERVLTNDGVMPLTGRQNCDVCNKGHQFYLLPGQSFPIDRCVSCGGEIVELILNSTSNNCNILRSIL